MTYAVTLLHYEHDLIVQDVQDRNMHKAQIASLSRDISPGFSNCLAYYSNCNVQPGEDFIEYVAPMIISQSRSFSFGTIIAAVRLCLLCSQSTCADIPKDGQS